jgi:transcriptional regulator with XRE-family HTH domain
VIPGMSETIPRDSDIHGVALVAALKAARAALAWSQKDLAEASGISKVTIARMEAGMISPRLSTVTALQVAMERSGVHLTLNEPAGGFLLRLEPEALHPKSKPAAKASSALTTEELLTDLGGTVVMRNAGSSQVKKPPLVISAKI